MEEMRGYSARLTRVNNEADGNHPGVMLGRLCIAQEIPVADVAQFFNVSRMTIYKWFKGEGQVRPKHAEQIEEIIAKLKNKVHLD